MDQDGVEVNDPRSDPGVFCLSRATNLKPGPDQPPSLGPLARAMPEGPERHYPAGIFKNPHRVCLFEDRGSLPVREIPDFETFFKVGTVPANISNRLLKDLSLKDF